MNLLKVYLREGAAEDGRSGRKTIRGAGGGAQQIQMQQPQPELWNSEANNRKESGKYIRTVRRDHILLIRGKFKVPRVSNIRYLTGPPAGPLRANSGPVSD